MKKRSLSFMLAIIMAVSCFPAVSFAAEHTVTVAPVSSTDGYVFVDMDTLSSEHRGLVNVFPADGKKLKSITVNDATLTDNAFDVPDEDVTITATFEDATPVAISDGLLYQLRPFAYLFGDIDAEIERVMGNWLADEKNYTAADFALALSEGSPLSDEEKIRLIKDRAYISIAMFKSFLDTCENSQDMTDSLRCLLDHFMSIKDNIINFIDAITASPVDYKAAISNAKTTSEVFATLLLCEAEKYLDFKKVCDNYRNEQVRIAEKIKISGDQTGNLDDIYTKYFDAFCKFIGLNADDYSSNLSEFLALESEQQIDHYIDKLPSEDDFANYSTASKAAFVNSNPVILAGLLQMRNSLDIAAQYNLKTRFINEIKCFASNGMPFFYKAADLIDAYNGTTYATEDEKLGNVFSLLQEVLNDAKDLYLKATGQDSFVIRKNGVPAVRGTDYTWSIFGSTDKACPILHILKSGLTISGASEEAAIIIEGDVRDITLDGVVIRSANVLATFGDGDAFGMDIRSDELTIVLKGNNSIGHMPSKEGERYSQEESQYSVATGISTGYTNSTTFTGDGNLTIYDYEDGFKGGNLIFDKDFTGDVNIIDVGKESKASEPPCAISLAGELTVNNGNFNLISYNKNGITANKININGGHLSVKGGAQALSVTPTLGRGVGIAVHPDLDGTEYAEYKAENISDYPYIVISSTKTAIKWNYYGDGDFLRPYPNYSSNLAAPQKLIEPGMWVDESMGEFWYKYEKAAGLTYEYDGAVWLTICDWTTDSGISSTVPGIYKVSWYIEPDDNHTYTEFYGQKVTRDNPAYDYTMLDAGEIPEITSAVLYSDLEYTGQAQKLCSAGSIDFSGFVPDESIIEYAVGSDNVNAPETGWSEAVPSRTEIDEYYVWHRWVSTSYAGFSAECLGCVEIKAPAPVYDAPDPVVSIPANHGYDSVKLKATVSGSNATLKEITDEDLEKLLDGENSDTVVLNFSGLSKNVKSVTIPKKSLEKIEAEMQKEDGNVEGLTIDTPNGTILLPSDTVTELLKQAEGNTIKFAIESIRESKLTKDQKETIKKFDKATLFDIYIESNGKRICTTDLGGFGGEVALMLLPYEMQKGQNKHNCKVFYIAEDGSLENIPALYNEDGQDFILELEHLSVYAVLYSENAPETCAKDSNCPLHEFSDTDMNAWYHDGVHYCIANGIMKGVGGNLFKPTATISRAEIVTMLWRLAGEPYVDYYMQFKDVKEGEWYSEAVRWAAAEKIVEGYEDGSFMPNKVMTREEVATVLCRFAKYIGQDIDKATEDVNTLSYNDIFDVSEWAKEGIHYCLATDIIEGNEDECVMPLRKTTRAEAATMIYRFCEKVFNK